MRGVSHTEMQDQIRQEPLCLWGMRMRNAQPQHAKCRAKRLGRLTFAFVRGERNLSLRKGFEKGRLKLSRRAHCFVRGRHTVGLESVWPWTPWTPWRRAAAMAERMTPDSFPASVTDSTTDEKTGRGGAAACGTYDSGGGTLGLAVGPPKLSL